MIKSLLTATNEINNKKNTTDGYSFNDENYDESLHCFEPKEE